MPVRERRVEASGRAELRLFGAAEVAEVEAALAALGARLERIEPVLERVVGSARPEADPPRTVMLPPPIPLNTMDLPV